MLDLLAAATKAGHALQTQDGGSIRAAAWTGVIIAALGLLGMIVTHFGGWKNSASAGREADFRRLREEIDTLRNEVRSTRERVEIAERRAGDMQLKMVCLQTACELVSGELARLDPDNEMLKRARLLIAQAAVSDESVFQAALAKLSTVGANRHES